MPPLSCSKRSDMRWRVSCGVDLRERCSPSPRPSPQRRGRIVRRLSRQPKRFDISERGVRCSLSLGERVGVRENKTFLVAIALLLFTTFSSTAATSSLREINPPAPANSNHITAIVGATLLDGRGGAPLLNSLVVVRGSKIMAVGERERMQVAFDWEM